MAYFTTLKTSSFQTRNEAQRSERFGIPVWRQPAQLVERKRGSKSLVPLRYPRVWNDEDGVRM
jgi:hypothetical protein